MTRSNSYKNVTSAFAASPGTDPAFDTQRTNYMALDKSWTRLDWTGPDWTWRQERQDHRRLGAKLQQEHRGYYADVIARISRDIRKRSSRDILEVLAIEYGFAWVDIAQMLSVSVPAIRKWRTTGGATPQNHEKLAELAAFVQALATAGDIQSPANWMLLPPLGGYTLTPQQVYTRESAPLILDYACGNISAEVMFDDLVQNWRETHESHYQIHQFDDGMAGIVRRNRGDA